MHLEGPLSRPLTESTGLNRRRSPTSSASWGARDSSKNGHPIRRVASAAPRPWWSARERVAIAVNPEVDALTVAAVGLDRSIPVRERIELDHLIGPDETAALVASRIDAWRAGPLAGARIVGVGLAVPGLVRAVDGLVRNAPHLNWIDAPIRDLVGPLRPSRCVTGTSTDRDRTRSARPA